MEIPNVSDPEMCQRLHGPSEGVHPPGAAAATAQVGRNPGRVEGSAGEAEGEADEERHGGHAGGINGLALPLRRSLVCLIFKDGRSCGRAIVVEHVK